MISFKHPVSLEQQLPFFFKGMMLVNLFHCVSIFCSAAWVTPLISHTRVLPGEVSLQCHVAFVLSKEVLVCDVCAAVV